MICKREILAAHESLHCPHCSYPFHGSHILEWAKIHGACPVCKRGIVASGNLVKPSKYGAAIEVNKIETIDFEKFSSIVEQSLQIWHNSVPIKRIAKAMDVSEEKNA